jgi:hypothetical protein
VVVTAAIFYAQLVPFATTAVKKNRAAATLEKDLAQQVCFLKDHLRRRVDATICKGLIIMRVCI